MTTPTNTTTPVPEQAVRIPIDSANLVGDLAIPPPTPHAPPAIVLFAHGSGSGRRSPRNRAVAAALREAPHHLATLLIDLLTEDEEVVDIQTRHLRFDIPLLARRLTAAIDWLTADSRTKHLPVGLFGASTGAAAALVAAASRPDRVASVVSRGGRPDLAGDALPKVRCPTLLLVGQRDEPVIDMNRDAQSQMTAPTQLTIIPRATHLFEEPGALEEVSRHAARWFTAHTTRA